MVKVLRTFRDGPTGRVVRPGDDVEPTPDRHDELAAAGLVPKRLEGSKAAQPALNKMAEPPDNKAISAPLQENDLPALPKRRGRPPKVKP